MSQRRAQIAPLAAASALRFAMGARMVVCKGHRNTHLDGPSAQSRGLSQERIGDPL